MHVNNIWAPGGAEILPLFVMFAGRVILYLLLSIHEKFLQFNLLRAVVFQLNLKYLHLKITNLLWVVV